MCYDESMYTVTFGGWYQRTTLHLSEIHGFLAYGHSRLKLSPTRLKNAHSSLNLRHVSREFGYVEYVAAETNDGITIRYYEDGLNVLQLESENIIRAQKSCNHILKKFLNQLSHTFFRFGHRHQKFLRILNLHIQRL